MMQVVRQVCYLANEIVSKKHKLIVVIAFPNRKRKSIWWMPWLSKAMKDAAWRRYAPGKCLATVDPEISEWGNLIRRNTDGLVFMTSTRTLGSKTFQYQVEKKPIGISLVAASETEGAQTRAPHHRSLSTSVMCGLGVVRRKRYI